MKGRDGFPYIDISTRPVEEGEPVYSHGYPLSDPARLPGMIASPWLNVSGISYSTRVTSAIVASSVEAYGPVRYGSEPPFYVIDKALNYGNSGGPVVAAATGKAFAFCSRFQPLPVPQVHMSDPDGNVPVIFVPSLYGIVAGLCGASVVAALTRNGVPFEDN